VLRNRSSTALAGVPLAIDVRGAGNRSVFRNNAPGLDVSLVSVPVLRGGQETTWIDDQVSPTGKPRQVKVQVGAPRDQAQHTTLPEVTLSSARLASDPVNGSEATGKATLRSGPTQRNLVVYCVARRAGRIVAAGRGVLPVLTSKRPAPYHVFFIGDPRGSRLSLSAPPTVL